MTARTEQRREFAETWNSELHRMAVRLFRLRLVLVPAFSLIFLVFLWLDPVPWKLKWIAATIVILIGASVIEYLRIRRRPVSTTTIQINLGMALLTQTSFIYITGGIESPVLPAYVPLGLVAGLSLGTARAVAPVVAIPTVATLVFLLGAGGGWLPRATPGFFGLDPGFCHQLVYVWLKGGTILFLVVGTSMVGAQVRMAYERITFRSLDTRKGALDSLESRNEEILSVASTVAHELKNPLSSIQGLAQLMGRTAAPGSKEAERIDVMRREIARMVTVLDEFRNFSRPISGLSLRQVDLAKLVEEIVVLTEGTAEGRGIRVVMEARDRPDVECDPQKIKQALLNLMQNALEASPDRGKVGVRVSMADANTVEVVIEDNGSGVSEELAERGFSPGVTTKDSGSGIGLVVARSIAEQHGGKLRLRNRSQGGCAAVFTFPVQSEAKLEARL